MLRKLYDKVIALSESRHALPTLAAVSFAESSFFPIPPDVILVPMALAQPDKARLYALVCTIASVLGGLVGYAIGALLFDTVGKWLISAYGYGDGIEAFRAAYAKWGAWIILIKGMTPIPFKIVTIASGFAGYNFFLFVLLRSSRAARASFSRPSCCAFRRADPRLRREAADARHHGFSCRDCRRVSDRQICVLRWMRRANRSSPAAAACARRERNRARDRRRDDPHRIRLRAYRRLRAVPALSRGTLRLLFRRAGRGTRFARSRAAPATGFARILLLLPRSPSSPMPHWLLSCRRRVEMVAGPDRMHRGVRPHWGEHGVVDTPVIRCDEASFRFLGLSFAGWDALVSSFLALLAFAGAAQRR